MKIIDVVVVSLSVTGHFYAVVGVFPVGSKELEEYELDNNYECWQEELIITEKDLKEYTNVK